MDYTLGGVYEHILDLTDKTGSDLFDKPFVRSAFITATYDFLREQVKLFENTQAITEDIRPLIVTTKRNVVDNPSNEFTVIFTVPAESFHLLSAIPVYKNKVLARKTRIARHGDRNSLKTDPHARPEKLYPHVYQYSDYYEIDPGQIEKPLETFLTYLKKPDFAPVDQDGTKIVNLSETVIHDLMLKTVDTLLGAVGDPRVNNAYRKDETFG